jgi:hypothetical protein
MNPDAARKLTIKLASKLALPDTTAMATPAPAAGTPQASSGTPGQTAAPAAAAQPKG